MHFRALMAALPLALLMAFLSFLLPVIPLGSAPVECLANSDFGLGLEPDGTPIGWLPFHGGSGASYRWGGSPLSKAGAQGASRISLVLSTVAREKTAPQPYVGLAQTAPVTPGAEYRFTIRGQLRSTRGLEGHCAVQWAVEPLNGPDSAAIQAWQEIPALPHGSGTVRQVESTRVVRSEAGRLTVFVRLLCHAPASGSWARVDLEEVSLVGPDARP